MCIYCLCLSPPVTKMYDYVFSENGLVAFKDGKLFSQKVSHHEKTDHGAV